ncbi:MAG TPA: glycosyltransferase [Acidimicrobiales bacterium]|nr:glycosyltransferase [Acidimicrobiales bacterium]
MPGDPVPDAPACTIVLPAHNEEEILATTVGELVEGLRDRGASFEVLVVENGSTDATAALAARLADEHPEVVALTDPTPDYGLALRRGLLTARGEVVVNFDVDYYDLDFFDRAIGLVRDGAGIVVGTKRGEGAQDDRPLARRIVTWTFATLLKVLFGLRASDTHGMKALNRERVVGLAERCRLGTDLFDTELVLRAERAGLVVAEIPVRVEERRPARSPIARRILRTLLGLRQLRLALREE